VKPTPTTNEVTSREPPQPTVLRGLRLFVARRAWVALTALSMVLFVASIPVAYARLSTECESSGCSMLRLSSEAKNVLEEGLGLSIGYYALYIVALAISMALGYWLIGVMLFWMRSEERLALYASMALVTFGAMQPDTLGWLVQAAPVLDPPVDLVVFVASVSFFLLFCVFPDGRFVPQWMPWAAVAWIAYQLLGTFFPDSPFGPNNWPPIIDNALLFGLLGALVLAQIHRYRHYRRGVSSEEKARQQTKWVVFGFTVAILVFFGVVLIGGIFDLTRPGIPELVYKSVGALVIALCALLIPLSIGVAILRHRLWDIDLIIRRSLIIGPLLTVLTAVFALAEQLLLPFLVQRIPGMEESSSINTVVSVLIVVVLIKPLHNGIEAVVKRLFDRLFGGIAANESPR
jgi:hypothetical protein